MKVGGFRAVLALLTSLLFVSFASVPVSAGPAFEPDPPTGFGSVAAIVTEKGLVNTSFIQGRKADETFHCATATDPNCVDIDGAFSSAFMPVCEPGVTGPCLEEISFRDNGTWSPAVFEGYGNALSIEADTASAFPRATSPLLFKANIGGSVVDLVARYNLTFSKDRSTWGVREMTLDISPYFKIFDSRITAGGPRTFVNDQGKRFFATGGGTEHIESHSQCLWSNVGVCGVRADFPASVSMRVAVRAPSDIKGWFEGRLKDPKVAIVPLGSLQRISVEAEPVEVNRVSYRTSISGFDVQGFMGDSGYSGLLTGPLTLWADAWGKRGFEFVSKLRDLTGDKSSGKNSLWSIKTIANAVPDKCLSGDDAVAGFVTTNSSVYSGDVPTFDSGYLSYQVAGMHYEADGKTLNLGTYDMVMRSDVARCLYGFTKAPVSATVQVVGTGGVENVATTTVSERDGWLKLAAYGFTFSEKEIRVTLDQVKVAVPKTMNLPRFKGTSTQLSLEQRWAIEDFVKASEHTKTVTCTSMFVNSRDRARALTRAKVACNNAKVWNSDYAVKAVVKQTKTMSLDGRVVMSSR